MLRLFLLMRNLICDDSLRMKMENYSMKRFYCEVIKRKRRMLKERRSRCRTGRTIYSIINIVNRICAGKTKKLWQEVSRMLTIINILFQYSKIVALNSNGSVKRNSTRVSHVQSAKLNALHRDYFHRRKFTRHFLPAFDSSCPVSVSL